jgi:hypothetical protein
VVERAAVRARGADPPAQYRLAGALLGLGEEIEEDRQLGPVVELAGEQGERVDVERAAQLVLGEVEELHEVGGVAQKTFDSASRRTH